MKKNIAILGKGNVGTALVTGFARGGHAVAAYGKGDASAKDAVAKADVVVVAVPFGAIADVVKGLGSALDGKVVVDVSNALTPDMKLALGFSTSGAEELQKQAPKAKVVKAFNTQFAAHMQQGQVGDTAVTAFAAGDDKDAKATVLQLGKDLGFDMVDAGGLAAARYLEPLGMLNIHLGYVVGLGGDIGLRLVRK